MAKQCGCSSKRGKVVKRMRDQFPDAKTFGATRQYFAEVHAEHQKRERIADATKIASLSEHLKMKLAKNAIHTGLNWKPLGKHCVRLITIPSRSP